MSVARITRTGAGIAALLGLAAMVPTTALADGPAATATAATHAGLAAAGTDLAGVRRHLHHVLNCLVGPGGEGFDAAPGNPGLAGGAIPQTTDAAMKAKLEKAAVDVRKGIASEDLAVAKEGRRRCAGVVEVERAEAVMRRAWLGSMALLVLAPLAPAATLLVLNKEDATLAFIDPALRRHAGAGRNGQRSARSRGHARRPHCGGINYGAPGAGNTLSVVDIPARRERLRADLAICVARMASHRGPGDLLHRRGRSAYRHARCGQRTRRPGGTRRTRNARTWSSPAATGAGCSRPTWVRLGEHHRSCRGWQCHADPGDRGQRAGGLDLTPDGRQLWTANAEDGSVSIVDVAQKKLVKSFDVGTRRSNRSSSRRMAGSHWCPISRRESWSSSTWPHSR